MGLSSGIAGIPGGKGDRGLGLDRPLRNRETIN